MGIKENGKRHYRDKLSTELLSVEVPEWGDKVYYRSTINGKKQSLIMSLYAQDKHIEAMAMSLIVRALDDQGNAVWSPKELQEVMRDYDNNIIGRIVGDITQEEPSVDEAKKP
jgi:hypothetical protein